MTPTEELAGLLRKAAEKDPEKFEVEKWEISDRFVMTDANGWEFRFNRLEEPDEFPCDCMDAIAEACGMEFEVDVAMESGAPAGWWSYHAFGTNGEPWLNGEYDYSSKRLASIAALCAILRCWHESHPRPKGGK